MTLPPEAAFGLGSVSDGSGLSMPTVNPDREKLELSSFLATYLSPCVVMRLAGLVSYHAVGQRLVVSVAANRGRPVFAEPVIAS